ncbi:MAG TPA: DAK2 domain-containing protein [Solirubrobacteraceae bacterium]|nr:DAK2 domain-containing protein [Solirubrobacteraceae bacterium]
MADPSLLRFRTVVEGALGELEARRQEVNDLNVFPVADGDTGDNMALTLRAVLDELDRLSEHEGPLDEIGREQIVQSVARAALLGARGNSGVILSQLIRGAAEELISRPGELVDPVLLGAAMARASDRAYGSVRRPAEGTILTVVREMAHRIATELAHMPQTRLTVASNPDEQDALLAELLARALDEGEQSVKRGPDLLPVLREAGVVDAGGYGLVVMFAGVVAALRGDAPPPVEHHAPARVTHPHHHSSSYRYCTNFAVTGERLEAAPWIERLEVIGDSVLVVGDAHTLKVHVHTDSPALATGLFDGTATVSRLDVADMRLQMAQRAGRLGNGAATAATCGVLAVVSGDGMAGLFASLGAIPLDGGQTLNPSTYDLLAGIHGVPAEQVVVLPNSPNVIMASERAAELSDKTVHVVRARSMQAGLAAAVALDPTTGAKANAAAMEEALAHVRTGAVTEAARDDTSDRFRRGEAVGFVDEQLVAWGEPAATLEAVLDALASDAELVTVIAGDGVPLDEAAATALAPAEVEVEYSYGGQPSYWWLIAAE